MTSLELLKRESKMYYTVKRA